MNDNPMEQLHVLQEKLREAAEALGLDLQAFVAIPGSDHGPHMAQAHFVLDPAKAFKSPEERATDDELTRMELAMRAESQEEKANEARVQLQESLQELQKGDGIGLDDGGIGLD